MIPKKELMKECLEQFNKPNVAAWYDRTMKDQGQYYTINQLEKAVQQKDLTVREALSIALIVGFQWNVNFEKEKEEA